ncbi:MAG: alpha/beta fold hydrolase [Bryobacteraceae bacterium]
MAHADNNGVRIYWEEHGSQERTGRGGTGLRDAPVSNEPLLLIMGLACSLDFWYRTVPVVSRRFRTILFDNRGVGKSDAPPGPYSILSMAADAAAVLDAAGVERANIFGVSMGGMIAQEFALQYPERVQSLILGCTASGGAGGVRAKQAAIDMLKRRASMGMEDALAAAIPFIYDAGTPRERIEEDLAVRRRSFPTPAAYQAQLQALLSWQSYDRLPRIAAPALVIHGENDRLVPPGNGQRIAERSPGAKLALLANASHLFVTDQPEAAHAAVLSFL